ncbi:hypothetical protein H6H03_13485 [Nostoc paludosum FACHB-159]|uniref:Histidine kinase n=1 Tax=Nostoc paludosum FACHB-159 TaxID=2692908 RepID=A0ABR8K839_9NOSO|nr:hypothetical protein [Nostoc sp. FACHB-857]MBD2734889.1 hypothetical protein [Nostoc paludosum FACHB-159]
MGHGAWGMGHGEMRESEEDKETRRIIHNQCPMPNAQCPMPHFIHKNINNFNIHMLL